MVSAESMDALDSDVARTGTTEARTRSASVNTVVGCSLLVLVGGILPVAIAEHFGALGIPRNDDWAFLISAFGLADRGTLNGNGWPSMNLVGQLVLSLPVVWLFGHRIGAMQVEVAALGVGGLLCALDLARQLLPPRRALFVALMVAVGPMWAALSVSYMTDIPAFALAMACLTTGARGIKRGGVSTWFWVSLVVGVLGFTVREYAIVAPIAVVLAALYTAMACRWPRSRLITILVCLFGLGVTVAGFLIWRRGLPGWIATAPSLPTGRSLRFGAQVSGQTAVLLGVLVAPAVLLANPRRVVTTAWRRAPRSALIVSATTSVWLVTEVARQWRSARFLGNGNYVDPNGALGTDTLGGTRPDLFPKPLLAALAVVGVLSVVVLACAVVSPALDFIARVRRTPRFRSSPEPSAAVVGLAALGYGGACLLAPVLTLPFFDRYLLPLVPLVGILVLRAGDAVKAGSCSRVATVAACMAGLVLAGFGASYAFNAASFDGAKWHVAEQVARVVPPQLIDGGLEWARYHPGTLEPARSCVRLRVESHAPSAESAPLGVERVWGPGGTQAWIVARKERPC